MKKVILALLLFQTAALVLAQTTVDGEAEMMGGAFDQQPWASALKLNFQNQKFSVSPYVRLSAYDEKQSEETRNVGYRYSRTGNRYELTDVNSEDGYLFNYGIASRFLLGESNELKFNLTATHRTTEYYSHRTERLRSFEEGFDGSFAKSNVYCPTMKRDDIDAVLDFRHKFLAPGSSMGVRYQFHLNMSDDEMMQNVGESENFHPFMSNHLLRQTQIQSHDVVVDWLTPLTQHQALDLGIRYNNSTRESDDSQVLDGKNVLNEDFRHESQLWSVIADYRVKTSAFVGNAKLSYEHTEFHHRKLDDFVPQVRGQWNISKNNSLSLLYAMRIIRPDVEVLSPAKIIGAYTLDFGNENLKGTHANRIVLAYTHKTEALTSTTSVTSIFANDGITAIWMEKDNVRVSTFGNEGIRRAWSLTSDLSWKASATTTIKANGEVMWDKRIAEAINMAKEHWGAQVSLSLTQKLPARFSINVEGFYSEGYTIDLYSHYSRKVRGAAQLIRTFLRNDCLEARLAYSYCEYPTVILTQGQYTGRVTNRIDKENLASLSLCYRFGKSK
ncbi:MAG: outer membrane beta-barrel protein [Bacteroidales bacterium]|nr:outer membrane beta-barrel protein [Candidatus Liminaster caballi]